MYTPSLQEDKWFVGIGGFKCATTWLAQCLREHPDVCMSPIKELHFFSKLHVRGADWYLNNFAGCRPEVLRGEFSTSYLYSEGTAKRIHDFCPKAKIVVILRDPVERLVSHYKHLVRGNRINIDVPVKESVKGIPALLEYGLYYKYLKTYYDVFGKENILVCVAEDITRHPEIVLQKIYAGLRIKSDFIPSVMKKQVSKGIIPRVYWIESFRQGFFYFLRRHGRADVINILRLSRMPEIYRRLNSNEQNKQLLSSEEKIELASYYKEDVARLRELTGCSLERWKLY
jgi:hypothetical protein